MHSCYRYQYVTKKKKYLKYTIKTEEDMTTGICKNLKRESIAHFRNMLSKHMHVFSELCFIIFNMSKSNINKLSSLHLFIDIIGSSSSTIIFNILDSIFISSVRFFYYNIQLNLVSQFKSISSRFIILYRKIKNKNLHCVNFLLGIYNVNQYIMGNNISIRYIIKLFLQHIKINIWYVRFGYN